MDESTKRRVEGGFKRSVIPVLHHPPVDNRNKIYIQKIKLLFFVLRQKKEEEEEKGSIDFEYTDNERNS